MRRKIMVCGWWMGLLVLLAGGGCAPCQCAQGGGGGKKTPVGEADRVKSTCGGDCECICLEFPTSHAGRRCACGTRNY